jgi:hypothetical protein
MTPALVRAQLMRPGALQASPSTASVPRQGRDSSRPRRRRFSGRNCRATDLPGSSPSSAGPATGLRSPGFRSPEKKFRIQGNNARWKWSRARRSKQDSPGGPMAYRAMKLRSKLARFPLMCWREPSWSRHAPDMRFPGRGLPGRSGGALGPPGEHYRTRSDEAVGARAGPRGIGHARQVSRAAGERRQGQRGHQANRQRKAGFSSKREVICRNYLREDIHGFCALRITQARARSPCRRRSRIARRQRAKSAMAKEKPASNFKLNSRANSKPEPGPASQSKARSE